MTTLPMLGRLLLLTLTGRHSAHPPKNVQEDHHNIQFLHHTLLTVHPIYQLLPLRLALSQACGNMRGDVLKAYIMITCVSRQE